MAKSTNGSHNKVSDDKFAIVRSIVGNELPEIEIIRALHLSKNDASAAINIIFDNPVKKSPNSFSSGASSKSPTFQSTTKQTTTSNVKENNEDLKEGKVDWWLVGCAELSGLSTCKGRGRIKNGERVTFSFPTHSVNHSAIGNLSPSLAKPSSRLFGRGRGSLASCSEIVRFSTNEYGEIGRIPNEWARHLTPLINENKIKVEGFCKSAPQILGLMDTVVLSISVYINILMFHKRHLTSIKPTNPTTESSTVQPISALFRLLDLTPFKKADFSPEDLSARKQSIKSKEDTPVLRTVLPPEKRRKLSSTGNKEKNDDEIIPDDELDNIVGNSDCSQLEEMKPPETLQCQLRSYQKQALHWMLQAEKGKCPENASTTLHPCWNAYHLTDKRQLVMYVNAFSGEATTEFPSTLQIARGGILADAMGLGKTIMTISLLLAHSGRGGLPTSSSSQTSIEPTDANHILDQPIGLNDFKKQLKPKASLIGGGNLIICPMTLLGQWKAEIETHALPNSLTVYVHYGQSRPKDAKFLALHDVVLTTYGVVASEFSYENTEENGGLYSVQWFRIVLDEAHTIKSSKSQISIATSSLFGDRRWCLTGTPIQNKLEDIYSLLRFLKIEPWGNWGLWYKLIQKPFEEGDERGLKLVQSILRQIMLRRTKSSTDKDGRPILDLPPANVEVIYCEMTEAEKDFYEALFKRSKVKFDQFVEQGRILHNYASILELLLRLRQCCDHPFLVMSRGDTKEFADLNKLAKRFLKGGKDMGAGKDSNVVLSEAYIKEVVKELSTGDESECPICLEAFEDAVLTPCAHRLCRECLLASWRNATNGPCPVCRNVISRQELITAPSNNRFQVDVEKNWVESCKISILLQELENLRTTGSKSIVFSQWTAFLDLLQIPFSRKKITFLRLDGTLNQQQREKVIKEFTEDSGIQVLLMSLKAGGVGINLTAASNAFLLDPWWNPAVEEQAVMRIHRIGQTKTVSIKRFIVKGTVEERMEAVQARKQKLISGALTDQEVRSARIEELKLLFT